MVRGRRIDFLGYCFTPGNTRMRKSIKQAFARKSKSLKNEKRRQRVLASYWGWCKHGNCRHLWNVITDNDMSFASKGIKQRATTKDGKKYFDVPEARLMDIVNIPVTILDFVEGIKTKQGDDRYCVLFEIGGEEKKFITNSYNIKDVLDQARQAEKEGQKIFPVENTVIKRRAFAEGRCTYYFEE